MDLLYAWASFIAFYLAPLAHVTFSPKSGPWLPPQGSRCPLSPRVGWIVLVLLLGMLGWLLYMNVRVRRELRITDGSGG